MLISASTMPRVAIIIPTYNRGHLVSRAIDSALGQRDATVRVVVVDDGSTDGTDAALAEYVRDPKVQVLVHSANRGVTAAKNTGLANVPAETEWVGILDSDDLLDPDAIRTLTTAVQGDADQYSQVIGWCEDAQTGAPTGRMLQRSGVVLYEDALCGRFAGEFWHLARRDLIAPLRFDDRASGGEAMLWWRLLRVRPAWLVPQVVRKYDRSGVDRVGIAHYDPIAANGRMWAYRAVLDSAGADMLSCCPRRYGMLMGEMSKWAALAGDRSSARAGAWQAIRHAPSVRTVLLLILAWAPPWMARWSASSRRMASRVGRAFSDTASARGRS